MRVWAVWCALCLPALAWATPNPYLAQARVFHQGLEFEKCLKRLETAATWPETTQKEFAEIELYSGLCSLGMGREKDAVTHFELGLRVDQKLQLPPLQSPRVKRLFAQTQQRVVASLEHEPPPAAQPVDEPVGNAPTATAAPSLTPASPTGEAAPAVTAAATREQSRRPRLVAPLVLAGVSLLAGGAAVYFGVEARSLATSANAATYQDDALTLGSSARTNMVLSNVAWGTAGALLVAAVITYFVLN